jgi:hypothetical protein
VWFETGKDLKWGTDLKVEYRRSYREFTQSLLWRDLIIILTVGYLGEWKRPIARKLR